MTTMESFAAGAVLALVCVGVWSRISGQIVKRMGIAHRERCLAYLSSFGYEARPYRPEQGISDVRLQCAISLLAQDGCLIHDASGRIIGLHEQARPGASPIRLAISNSGAVVSRPASIANRVRERHTFHQLESPDV